MPDAQWLQSVLESDALVQVVRRLKTLVARQAVLGAGLQGGLESCRAVVGRADGAHLALADEVAPANQFP